MMKKVMYVSPVLFQVTGSKIKAKKVGKQFIARVIITLIIKKGQGLMPSGSGKIVHRSGLWNEGRTPKLSSR